MSKTPNQITRREILKRGAFVGGAVIWATPVVQTLGMGRAFAATPSDHCLESWATAFVALQSHQGLRWDDTAVLPARSNRSNALYAPGSPAQDPLTEEPYYSLGFGGWLVLELGIPYWVGRGGTSVTVETTALTHPKYPEEKALVEVAGSATGPWWPIGTATNLASPALAQSLDDPVLGLPSSLIITHLRITDTSVKANFPDSEWPGADAFDLDAAGISCPTP